ncbi:MAG: GNAT family N-acetyltransferase [Acetobacteraceae bacterium]|nr:GNAT family N-acetyltransferase [Acetobacteraceae bacterium]
MPTRAEADVETYGALDSLPADVGDLFRNARTIFGRRAWWRVIQDHGMPAGTATQFVVCRLNSVPAALFPMQTTGGDLESLTTPYTCLYEPLLGDGLQLAERRQVFTVFAKFCAKRPVTRLDALDSNSGLFEECAADARAAGLGVIRFTHFENWYEPVAGVGWSAYLAARPGALRETVRRKLRRAERDASARFEIFHAADDIEPGIAAYETVYRKSWKEPEPFPEFNAALMRALAPTGVLRLGVFYIGGEPIAVQFWIVDGGKAIVLKLAHDEAFKAASPGTVLTAFMLRHLLDEERVAEIDFGRGNDRYKRDWTSRSRQRAGLVLVNPWRARGLAMLARHAAGRARAAFRCGPTDTSSDANSLQP